MQDPRLRSFTDPNRTTPLGMLRYAIEFYAAAIATDDAIGETAGHDITAPVSVNYLIGHSIELTLKAYVLQAGGDLALIKRIGHRLREGYRVACELGLGEHYRPTDEHLAVLEVMDVLYSDKQFEYIETGVKHFPVFGPLQDFARQLLLAVANAIPSGKGFLRPNHKPGQYLRA